ncbi:MAG: F0F1 ATP synthase subunit B [Proteobacteria bacterium]|nr:F0F1 ATP synthase subunit B [Pseudomonadota bacterium]
MASPPKAASGESHGAHAATTASTAADPHGGHGGGHSFPPFDPNTFAPQLVWLAITFAFLYLMMSKVALPRVASVLAERRDRIQRDLAEAERLKTETDTALHAYEKSLSDARGKAQSLAKDMRDKVSADLERERQRVDGANAAKLAETEKRIADTKAKALSNVDQLAAETASAIVERLIGQDIGADGVRRDVGTLARV